MRERSSPATSSTTRPWCSMMVREPMASAWRMLCVTMRAVSRCSVMMRAVSSSTNAAVRGSSAATCSSSSTICIGRMVAMRRLAAWRCPPERRPIGSRRRFSSPSPRRASSVAKRCLRPASRASAKPRCSPRLAASARFSSTVSVSQVPARGSWNTRATSSARRQAGKRVTSRLPMMTRPASTGSSPAITFRSVDFPAPLEPITVTNSPVRISTDKPWNTRFSSALPRLKAREMPSTRITAFPSAADRRAKRPCR